jgi:hypothetical protein
MRTALFGAYGRDPVTNQRPYIWVWPIPNLVGSAPPLRHRSQASAERTQMPVPSRAEPERVWEFPTIGDLAEAMPPLLPSGSVGAEAETA